MGVGILFELWWLVSRTPHTYLYSRLMVCSDLFNLPGPECMINCLNSLSQTGPYHLISYPFLRNFLESLHVLDLCFDLLPKRFSNRRPAYGAHLLVCFTSAALMPTTFKCDNDHSGHARASLLGNWSTKWQPCMRSGSFDNWFKTLARSHCFLFLYLQLSRVFEKSRKQKIWFPKLKW